MIAGKAAGLIDDLASHAARAAILSGNPATPSKENQAIYRPLIEKYILLEQSLNDFFTRKPR
jgi:hypothetical protein